MDSKEFNHKTSRGALKGHSVYVLINECNVLGTWTNLKHLCNDMSEKTEFVSYSKLSKEVATLRKNGTDTGKLEFTTKDGVKYTVQIDVLR
jgi:hypothetical protein